MTPDELRAKLAETDAKLAATLHELGLTAQEIADVLDLRLPAAERKRRTEAAVARVVGAQLNDPSSPLLQRALDLTADALDQRLAREQRTRRRRFLVIGGAILGVALAVGGYLVLWPANPCAAALGPLSETEAIAGFPLRADKPIGPFRHGRSCTVYVQAKSEIGNPVVIVNLNDAKVFPYERSRRERERFASRAKIDLGDEAWLFVAGDIAEPTADDLARRVAENSRPRRVRGSGDPIGDALADLPPAHHVIVVRRGSTFLDLAFERKVFTPESSQALAAKIVARAK